MPEEAEWFGVERGERRVKKRNHKHVLKLVYLIQKRRVRFFHQRVVGEPIFGI